jgi:hypothetical protein
LLSLLIFNPFEKTHSFLNSLPNSFPRWLLAKEISPNGTSF